MSCVSLLHHIPDYLDFVRRSGALVSPGGVWFSFQDPLYYPELRLAERLAAQVAYAAWRLTRPDALGGMRRRLRRSLGVYRPDCVQDNVEFHVVRRGLDDRAIVHQLSQAGFTCGVETYWSTQSKFGQKLGERMGWQSSFSVVAKMAAPTAG